MNRNHPELSRAGKKRTEPRQANMELLRIAAMLGITSMHYLYWNGAILQADVPATGLRTAGSVIESFCVPMVAVYVMISGYYDRSTEFRWGRIARLCAEVWFYSILLHLGAEAAGISTAGDSIWDQALYFLPVMMNHYWFATAFIVMELFTPLLNAGADRVSRRTLKNCILGLLIYESVLKTVIPFQLTQDRMGYDAGFFLMMFLIGAYLARYGAPLMIRSGKRAVEGYAVSCILLSAEQIGASLYHERTGGFTWLTNVPFHYNHLLAVSASVCLFLAFTHVRIPEGKASGCIRAVSPLTFGVYLIQCHADLLPIWPEWLAGLIRTGSEESGAALTAGAGIRFFLWMVVSVILVYVVCSLMDALRRILFDGVVKLCRR